MKKNCFKGDLATCHCVTRLFLTWPKSSRALSPFKDQRLMIRETGGDWGRLIGRERRGGGGEEIGNPCHKTERDGLCAFINYEFGQECPHPFKLQTYFIGSFKN